MCYSRGFVHGVFLLARAARINRRRDVDEWIAAAREPHVSLGATSDLGQPANLMIQAGLARCRPDGVEVDTRLLELSESADGRTFRALVRLLLASKPPVWLQTAVTRDGVRREYIPSHVLATLTWLEPELDDVLRGAFIEVSVEGDDALRKAMGDAAELFVMSALHRQGVQPLHVAMLSDTFGYDIEIHQGPLRRIEVKAAGITTKGRFHLSRNEFDKSRLYGGEWALVQVVFTSSAHLADILDPSHVAGFYQLTPGTLSEVVPADTPHFNWEGSALITPSEECWKPMGLEPESTFRTAGFSRSLPVRPHGRLPQVSASD